RIQAESSLQEWLDGDDSVLAGSTIASWDGVSDTAEVEATDSEVGYRLATHEFTIRTPDETYYRAAVRIDHTPSKGVKVIQSPAITPIAATAVGDWDPVEPTQGWRETSASAAATDA